MTNNLTTSDRLLLARLNVLDQECLTILKGIHTLSSHCGDLSHLHLSYAFDDVRDGLDKLQREVAAVAHLFPHDSVGAHPIQSTQQKEDIGENQTSMPHVNASPET